MNVFRLVLCLAVPIFNSLTPRKASNIRILFLEDPDPEFNREALLRARQAAWQFGEEKYNWDLEKGKLLGVLKQAAGRVVLR